MSFDYYNYGGYGDVIGAGRYGDYRDGIVDDNTTQDDIEKARKALHEIYEQMADDGIY